MNQRSIPTISPSALDKMLEKIGAVSDHFYDRLLAEFPDLKGTFSNTDIAKQKVEFAAGFVEILRDLDKPGKLASYLEGLGIRHLVYNVVDPDYQHAQTAFIESLLDVFPEASDSESKEWAELMSFICNQMQASGEKAKYKEVV